MLLQLIKLCELMGALLADEGQGRVPGHPQPVHGAGFSLNMFGGFMLGLRTAASNNHYSIPIGVLAYHEPQRAELNRRQGGRTGGRT